MGSLRPVLLSNSEIAERYVRGCSISELMRRTKASHGTIVAILQVQGVPLRSKSQQQMLAAEDRRQRKARVRQRMGLA